MRHLLVVLVVVGCGDPPVDSRIDVFPGRVTTVKQGGMLQLALRADGADPMAFDLAIDDPTAALFDTHSIAPLTTGTTGAIITLVPSCTPLANAAPDGVVAMTVGAPGFPRETLTVHIVADPAGVCAGAVEHVVTSAVLALATVPDPSTVLCTTASVEHASAAESRDLLQLHDASGATAGNGKLLCGGGDVRLEVWPPIDALTIETIDVDTFACAIDTCGSIPVDDCCSKQTLAPLTASTMSVPTRSVAEIDKSVDGEIACADLDGDGTPELVLSRLSPNGLASTVYTEVDADQRWTRKTDGSNALVQGLLGFAWQSGATSTDVEWGILANVSGAIARAHFDGQNPVTWDATDHRLQFNANGTLPSEMLPIATKSGGGARYLAWLEGTVIRIVCISDSCATQTIVPVTVGANVSGVGIADYDGDSNVDFIVSYRPGTQSFGAKFINLVAYKMSWTALDAQPPQAPLVSSLEVPSYSVSFTAVGSDHTCDRIYVLSNGAWSSIAELASPMCDGAFTARSMPIVNDVHAITTIDQHLVIGTALGIFKLSYVYNMMTMKDDAVWRLEDPLLEENVLTTGDTLVDPATSHYAQHFVPCFADPAGPKSIAFEVARGGFEWTQLDIPVETFTVGTSP